MSRRPALSTYTQRLTPAEVARNWFRRGPDFMDGVKRQYPDFPAPGPDGLFLLSQISAWFDRLHGIRPRSSHEEEELLKVASGKR